MAQTIQNPKKTFLVDRNSAQVKKAIESIHKYTDKYKQVKVEESLYTLESSAYFGRIVHVEICYVPVGENKTELTIEAKNKSGHFNGRQDMNEVHRHLQNSIELMYLGLKSSNGSR